MNIMGNSPCNRYFLDLWVDCCRDQTDHFHDFFLWVLHVSENVGFQVVSKEPGGFNFGWGLTSESNLITTGEDNDVTTVTRLKHVISTAYDLNARIDAECMPGASDSGSACFGQDVAQLSSYLATTT